MATQQAMLANIRINNNAIFEYTCMCNYLELVQWLCSLNKDYIIEIEDDKIIKFYVIKELTIKKSKKINEIKDCIICYKQSNVITSCGH